MSSTNNVAGLVSYLKTRFNSTLNLIAVGTSQTSSGGGVSFYFMDSPTDLAPTVPDYWRIIPNENWKDAMGFWGLNPSDSMASTVFASIEQLRTTVGWYRSMNDESTIGRIIPYSKHNVDVAFTKNRKPPLPTTPSGQTYAIVQATPWDYFTQTFFPPDMNYQNGLGLKVAAIDETLFQALNFYLRGRTDYAMQNLNAVAGIAHKNSDGSVYFGSLPARGMYLGVFYECWQTIGPAGLPSGITITDVENTIWGLQNSDGGISRNYSSFSSRSNSDDETTNAALNAFSPGVIQYVKSIASSGQYNLSSIPDPNASIAPTTTPPPPKTVILKATAQIE
jgi:hypothetical protein